ncbi:MAG: twin-arginine translocase TatA/TatE family subunit [bacterium]|nr:twin-arginine translocase TatA/TatE family subunit [bacterium]
MFSNLGSGEIVVIAIIVLVLFGNKKLNELAKGLGQSVKEIKKIKKDIEDDI